MRAMVLDASAEIDDSPPPLTLREVEPPRPDAGELRVRVTACAVCRTDLTGADGALHRIERHVWFRSWNHDPPTPSADLDRAISLGEDVWQRTAVGGCEPQPEEMPPPFRLGVVFERRPSVERLVIVKQLDISRCEPHIEPNVIARRERIQTIHCLNLFRTQPRDFFKPLCGLYEVSGVDGREIPSVVIEDGHFVVWSLARGDFALAVYNEWLL